MTEYKINCWGDSFIYWEHDNTIGISLYNHTKCLSNDELNNYIADSITHEHIHKILYELFGETVCKLFDAIEHNFRDHKLHKKGMLGISEVMQTHTTYKSYIEKWGFEAFLEYYHIDNTARNQAYIICGGK